MTGASAGVGRATARALAAGGFDVALLARGRAGLEAAAAEVEAEGAAQTMPDVVAPFAARTAVDSKQTEKATRPGRPSDLHRPVDETKDHGARGTFGDRAHGVRDPAFLRSLPGTVLTMGKSAGDAVGDRLARRRG